MSIRRLGLIAVMATALAGVAGCTPSGAVLAPAPEPSLTAAPVPVPEGAVRLAQLGVQNGPGQLTLPRTVQIGQRVDQPNLVTLVIDPADGALVQEHLSVQVPLEGGTITAGGPDALVFVIQGWEGAYTFNEQQAALALRRSG